MGQTAAGKEAGETGGLKGLQTARIQVSAGWVWEWEGEEEGGRDRGR